jgi:hypothetical protein
MSTKRILEVMVMIFLVPDPDMRQEIIKGDYAMKYAMTAVITKTAMSPIVMRWSMSSPPRRSNFPKSPVPGTIERPVPLACIITTMMMRTESMKRRIERIDIVYNI